MKAPYSDNYMTYDASEHRYVLTEAFVREKMNTDLASLMDTSFCIDISNETERLLDRVSRMIYGYIYRLCPHRYAKERELALDGRLRSHLQSAMAEQIIYIMFNGDLSLSGTEGDTTERLRKNEIAPMARDILVSAHIVRIAAARNERDIEPKYGEEEY